MAVAFVVLCLALTGSILYILTIRMQLRSINRQLTKRLTEHTRQPVSLALIDRELSTLAANINKCLKLEETLRLNSIREEKHFKEMISNISHDLRTPLTAIKGYQQLMEKGELDSEQREKLRIAQKHADQLGSLIEHFFEYSYLLSSEAEPKPERINLTNLTADCFAASVTALEEKHLTVRFEESPPVFAFADREMTTRILQNLISNCVQHAHGEITVRLWTDKSAILSFRNPVQDVSNLDAERLFDRFYTADQARNQSTGLGLSIVKLLAGQMGGNVKAELHDGSLEIQVGLPLSK